MNVKPVAGGQPNPLLKGVMLSWGAVLLEGAVRGLENLMEPLQKETKESGGIGQTGRNTQRKTGATFFFF